MKLVMLRPASLPRTIGELRSGPVTAEVAELGRLVVAGDLDDADLFAALQGMPIRPAGVKLDPGTTEGLSRKEAHFAIHDRFFGVFRSADGAAEVFAHSMLVGYRTVLRDALRCGAALDADQWGSLRRGLEASIGFVIGVPAGPLRPRPVPRGADPLDPHRRWRSGHHAFFPLIQAITLGLNCFCSAALGGSAAEADEALAFATSAMLASGNAMRFAASFRPADYGGAVRPAMAPPYLPVGLSGVMSEDHDLLIRRFRELREVFPGLTGSLRDRREEFIAAVETTYDAHKGVCARFDGEHVVSLRMNNDSTAKAVQVLAQLERSRLGTLRSS